MLGAVEVGQPGAVPHHVANGDLRLAVGAELRPVLGDGRVVVDQRSVDEPVDDRGGHALGRGEHHGARVGGPVRGAATVGPARPDIDDGLTVQEDRQRTAAVPGTGKHLGEHPHRAGEMRVGRPLNTVRERCAAFPAVNVLHNASNLPGTPANKPDVTDPLIQRMSALPRRRRTAICGLRRDGRRQDFSAASRICWAASVGVNSPSRTWRSTSARILRTAGLPNTRSSTVSRTIDQVQSTC